MAKCWLCGEEVQGELYSKEMLDHHREKHPESWKKFVENLEIVVVPVKRHYT